MANIHEFPEIQYRLAREQDLPAITAFVDFWLAGKGNIGKVPGAAHDYFVPAGRHLKFVTRYTTILALLNNFIVGWCVKTHKDVLIHLLVAGTFRNQGIGSRLLIISNPKTIRSKIDQTAGDPAQFYIKHGYSKLTKPRQGRKQNIELFERVRDFAPTSSSPAHSREIPTKTNI